MIIACAGTCVISSSVVIIILGCMMQVRTRLSYVYFDLFPRTAGIIHVLNFNNQSSVDGIDPRS